MGARIVTQLCAYLRRFETGAKMVVGLKFDVLEDIEKQGVVSQRKHTGIAKKTLFDALVFWHEKYIDSHFKRVAYNIYKDSYPRRKRRGAPFVLSGSLRKKITNRQGVRQKIKGTSKSARLVFDIGRPPKYDKKFLEQMVLKTMFEMPVPDYGKAKRKVLSSYGYGKKNIAAFNMGISAIRQDELNRVVIHMKEFYFRQARRAGRRKRRTIRG